MTPRTYPRYAVVRDYLSGSYEVARFDAPEDFTIVQANIRTLGKACKACEEWIQREESKHVTR